MAAQASVSFLGGMAFEGLVPSGHRLILDADRSIGGEDRGPRPMELVLVALAGCTGMDVVSILSKRRAPLSSYSVEVQAERSPTHPKVYTALVVHHRAAGPGLAPSDVDIAVRLSATKYCSVSAMLRCTAEIIHKYTVLDEATGQEFSKVVEIQSPGQSHG
jgi:putative redox protein